jgi:GAF domain-containing protein
MPAANNELRDMVDRLQRVLKATRELNSTLDLSELARIILRIVRDEVGIERGTVFVLTPGGESLRSLVAQEVDEEIHLPVGKGIAGTVARTGEAVNIPDAYRDKRFDPSFDFKLGFRTRDIYCMPLRNRVGSVVGVLQLLNRKRDLTADDENFLADVSVHMGHAVENATRHLQILEQKKIEQQLELAREIITVRSVQKSRLMFSVLAGRCPICLGGGVFARLFSVQRACNECGFFFQRQTGSVLGSAFYALVATIAAALGLSYVIDNLIGDNPRMLAAAMVATVIFLLWFFRFWRVLWMALDLYSNPPIADDFDAGKGYLSSQANLEPQTLTHGLAVRGGPSSPDKF